MSKTAKQLEEVREWVRKRREYLSGLSPSLAVEMREDLERVEFLLRLIDKG
jgi:hypothetical protein